MSFRLSRFCCAALVRVDKDCKRFEHYGPRDIWDGRKIWMKIRGHSNLYILEEEVIKML